MSTKQKTAFADRKMLGRAIKDSFVKLSPKTQAKNPVMFLVFVAAILTSILWVVSLFGLKDAPSGYTLAIAVILWFTVLFANFAEAIAEGRGKAQADSLRASRKDVDAHKIPSVSEKGSVTVVPSALLKKGELVIVKAGEQIPADGEVVEGAASVDESAITGESAPVIREAGGDRSAVTGGTTVLSDWIVVRVTNEAGESFLDKMIARVEGAARKKTPNEIALQIFLVALSIIFILVRATSTGTASTVSVRLLTHKTRMIWRQPSQMWNVNSTKPTTRLLWKARTSATPRFGTRSATAPFPTCCPAARPARKRPSTSLERWMNTLRQRTC